MEKGRRAIIWRKKEARQKKNDFKTVGYNNSETYTISIVTSMKAHATSQAVCGWILTTDVRILS
jgi:hypothetical protein